MSHLPITLLSLALSLGTTQPAADPLASQPAPVPLFNGRNLDGWYTFIRDRGRDTDPRKVFTVQDGILRISGEEWGCITTQREYDNYVLIVEYKWGRQTWAPREDKARDSGVLIHSIGSDGGYARVWMPGIEIQMIEGGTGDLLVVPGDGQKLSLTAPAAPEKQAGCHVFAPEGKPATITSGRINWWGRDPQWKDVKNFRGPRDVEKPLGEWNHLEIVAKGKTIDVRLNGRLVNRAIDVTPTRGRIQVQSESAEVFIRRIDLRLLSK